MTEGNLKRVLVLGSGGAGKSTLAAELSRLLDLPLIHLDVEQWNPGWIETPTEKWRPRVAELCKRDSWVMDGNYKGSLDIRIPAADTIIFMDFPRLVCLFNLIRRIIHWHGRTRPDVHPGCPERFDMEMFRWVWTFPRNARPEIMEKLQDFGAGKRVILLHSRRETSRFLASLKPRQTPSFI